MTDTRILPKDWLLYYHELIRTWSRRADSRHDAEDAAHDVLALALEGKMPDNVSSPGSFLHRCVRNRLTDMHRRTKILDTVPLQDLQKDAYLSHDNPDAEFVNTQLADSLAEALEELPLKCRQVFIWQKIEGYSQEEIAGRLDISVNMVQKYMIRALRHLRDRLKPFSGL